MAVRDQSLKPLTVTKTGEIETTLEVRTIDGDVLTAWEISHAISNPQTLTFRWSTTVSNPKSARRRVTGLTANGSPVVLQETMVLLPQGPYGFFSYPIPEGFTGFIVQVIVTDQGNQEYGSVSVTIGYGPPGGPTPIISLPRVVLTINKISMIDDSDDTSTGEINFCFWASYSGSTTPQKTYYNGDFDSGSSANPGVEIAIDPVPKYVTLHAKGRDDDTSGGFTSPGCGGSTSEYDFASGSRNLTLPTGAVSTEKTPFSSFKATGSEDLEFRVHGSWQIVQ